MALEAKLHALYVMPVIMIPSTPVVYHSPQPRLLDQVREVIRFKHYSLKAEEAYVYWVRYFITWNGRQGQMRHPRELGAPEVQQFLSMRFRGFAAPKLSVDPRSGIHLQRRCRKTVPTSEPCRSCLVTPMRAPP